MKTSETRRTHPRYADQLHRDMGPAYKAVSKYQTTAARVLGYSESELSRFANARRPSAGGRFLEEVHDAVLDPHGDPGQLVALVMLTAEVAACKLDLPELYRRIEQKVCQETLFQAGEDVAQMALCRAVESRDPKRIGDACLAYQRESLPELGAQTMLMVYTRAVLVHLGLRASPEVVR